jgi:hypothetical protein
MADTSEIQLSLASMWQYLRTHVVDGDIGPYPQKQIIIGGGLSHRKPDTAVEIARQDAVGACDAWKRFAEGHRQALHDPRLGHVMETLGYMSGLRSGLPFTQAVQFGEWLSNKITGWTDGETAESDVRHLERVAKRAVFRPAVKAVIDALRPEQPPLVLNGAPCTTDGIVSKVVCSPLSAVGTVRGARMGINVYLHTPDAPDIEFMDPKVPGFAIPGRLEIEMGDGFERIPEVPLSKESIVLVTGTPQQSIIGSYRVDQGENDHTFVIRPTSEHGLSVDDLMTSVPGGKKDPIRQRGIKVIHIGLFQAPFRNWGERGQLCVRLYDQQDKLLHQGRGSLTFLPQPVPQIHPNNLSDERRNHNWQRIKTGDVLGHTPGTVPIALMLYDKAIIPPQHVDNFKLGIVGAGVLSARQLQSMGYCMPKELSRYTGGLIVQDMNNNGRLDPTHDRIIGGVIEEAPTEAQGQELRTLERNGKLVLSRPTVEFDEPLGVLFGGAIMQLQFIAGNQPGKYRPTLALLRDPADLASGDGSSYTYTILVE